MIYAFGEFEFDEDRWELRARGAPLEVPPKVMQTIAILLRYHDRVVSSEELLLELWPGVVVTNASLMKSVRIARQLLGDDGDLQRFIKTSRGRGYRFVAPVRELTRPSRPPSAFPSAQVSGYSAESVVSLDPARGFVGREAELAELLAALDGAFSSRAHFALVAGEPGIGKTRLLEIFGELAGEQGARVEWGRCSEAGGAPELWPWIQIVHGLFARANGDADTDPVRDEVLKALLDWRARDDTSSWWALFRSESGRFRTFDAIGGFLGSVARRAPLVLLLEDLHTADAASLILLRFLVRDIRNEGVVFVATFRPSELSARPALASLYGKLVGEARLLTLTGLAEDGTRKLIESSWNTPPAARLVAAVQRVTEGNPLFVKEIVRLLTPSQNEANARPDLEGVRLPARIVESIRTRFDSLPQPTRELLSVAAVIGREFEVRVLKEVSGVSPDELTNALDTALGRQVIARASGQVGTYLFAHMLFRDVLYDELGIARRAALHRRIGEVLEQNAMAGMEPPAAQLAFHFLRAPLGSGSEKAAIHCIAAGKKALLCYAFEEAAGHFENALEALRFERARESSSIEALLSLGHARRLGGEYSRASEAFGRAVTLARSQGDLARMAKAALGYAQVNPESGLANLEVIRLLEELVRLLDQPDARAVPELVELRSLALARLATCLCFAERREQGDALSRQALEIARAIDSPLTLAHALLARHWVIWRPGTAEERLAMASELVDLERLMEDSQPSMDARICQITDLLELGRSAALDQAISSYGRLARASQDPAAIWHLGVFEATRSLFRGRFDDAEQQANSAFSAGRRIYEQNARSFYAVQLWWIQIERGRASYMESICREELDADPSNALLRSGLVRLYSEIGATDLAREQLEILGASDFAGLREDWSLLPVLAHLAAGCALLGDAARADLIEKKLSPLAGSHVVAGPAILYLGPVSFYLALCAQALSQLDVAIERLEQAYRESATLGAQPMMARARLQLASTLLRRAKSGDSERAIVAAEQALSRSRELGMASLERQAEMVCAELNLRRKQL